jgi:hypothetical protein
VREGADPVTPQGIWLGGEGGKPNQKDIAVE